MNKITLIGRVGKVEDKGNFVKLSLATSKKIKGEDVTQWHSLMVFGKTMDVVKRYVEKGSLIGVEGELTYTIKEGVRYANILVSNLEILSWKKDADKLSTPKEVKQQMTWEEDDDSYLSPFLNAGSGDGNDFPF